VSIKKSAVFELSDRVLWIIVGIAALCAVFVRVWKFGSVPGGFNQDGAMAAVDAKALADYGTDRFGMKFPVHFTAWGYGQMSVLLSYLMVPFIKLFGLSEVTARMPQLLLSLAGLVFLYLFVRDTAGKTAAAVTAVLAAVNPWHILQSRWALDCNALPHVFIIGLYLLNRGIMKNKSILTYASMFFFAMCMYCYGITIYTVTVFLLAAGIYAAVKKYISVKQLIICAAVYLFFAWPFILTMVINFLKIDSIETPLFTIPYFPDSMRSSDLLFFSDKPLSQLVENVKCLMNAVFLQKKDLPWNDIEGFGTMYIFAVPFALLGIYSAVRGMKDNIGCALTVIFLLTGIWSGLITGSVNVNRINIIYYAVIILTAMGLMCVFRHIRYAHIGVAAVYAISFVLLCHTYFTDYAASIRYQFFEPFANALKYTRGTDAEKIYVTADVQYKGSSNVSEILTMFHHNIDALYFQGKTNIQDGTERLPYSERYTFASIDRIEIKDGEDAVYIITEADKKYFDAAKYKFTDFGTFEVAEKK
jgi:4-amino-4-deoxy-L-arabinose transferase-like glycosyltransferase